MNPISTMKNKWLACSVAAVLLGSATLACAAGSEPVMHSADNIAYVSGGVGTESLDRLTAISGQFNVKLVFAMNSGEYVSGVRVVIVDSKNGAIVDAVSDGPWFLTSLPAGNYQIAADLAGRTEKHQIAVGTSKLMTVDFRWSAQ